MRGDVVVLRNGLVELTGAEIEISQRVGSIPVGGLILDDRAVFRDGQIELPLAEQLLRFAERSLAIKWHRQRSWKNRRLGARSVSQSYQIPAAAQAD